MDVSSDALLSRRERAAVVARITALMEFWHISLDEIARTPTPVRPPAPRVIKYRHPVSGETWDGQGQHPEWLRHALLKEGWRVDELKPAHQAPTEH